MKLFIARSVILCALLLLFAAPTANAAAPHQVVPDPAGDWARIQKAGKLVIGATHDFPITVNVSGSAGYSINFWVDRDTIDAGQCTTLRWDVRNVQAVYLNGEGVAGVSQREVCPSGIKTYDLVVTRPDGGQDSRQLKVHVNNTQPQQSKPRIKRFDVDRNMVFIGECITLEWRTDDAEGVGIERNGDTILQAGPGNGSQEDCYGPVGVNEYKLIAYNRAGREDHSLSVVVQDAGD